MKVMSRREWLKEGVGCARGCVELWTQEAHGHWAWLLMPSARQGQSSVTWPARPPVKVRRERWPVPCPDPNITIPQASEPDACMSHGVQLLSHSQRRFPSLLPKTEPHATPPHV